jgi:hypothetical protein
VQGSRLDERALGPAPLGLKPDGHWDPEHDGGMRWIEERVAAVVQLRRIEASGDFDRFMESVHRRMQAQVRSDAIICRLQSNEPAALPTLGAAA